MAFSGIQGKPTGPLASNVLLQAMPNYIVRRWAKIRALLTSSNIFSKSPVGPWYRFRRIRRVGNGLSACHSSYNHCEKRTPDFVVGEGGKTCQHQSISGNRVAHLSCRTYADWSPE